MEVGCDVWFFVLDDYIPPKKVNTSTEKKSRKNHSMAIEILLDELSSSIKEKVGQCRLEK